MPDVVVVKTFLQRYEAEMAQGLLTGQGIESFIVADDCGGFRPHLPFGMGGVRLSVRETDLPAASDALMVLDDDGG